MNTSFKKDTEDVKAPKRVEMVIKKVRRLAEYNNVNPNIVDSLIENFLFCFVKKIEIYSKL